jgi:hypothetical protein
MNELTPRRVSPARIAAVTAGLSAVGAVAGAGVGLAMTLVTGGFYGPASVARLLLSAAAAGAACGAVLFPIGTWALMRRVPLGRALLWTLVPSTAGAALALGFFGLTAPVGIAGATAGFLLAAWRLRRGAGGTHLVSPGA